MEREYFDHKATNLAVMAEEYVEKGKARRIAGPEFKDPLRRVESITVYNIHSKKIILVNEHTQIQYPQSSETCPFDHCTVLGNEKDLDGLEKLLQLRLDSHKNLFLEAFKKGKIKEDKLKTIRYHRSHSYL